VTHGLPNTRRNRVISCLTEQAAMECKKSPMISRALRQDAIDAGLSAFALQLDGLNKLGREFASQ